MLAEIFSWFSRGFWKHRFDKVRLIPAFGLL
jgi:hypothetical protein